MEYKISEVKFFSDQTYGKFANHRTVVIFEGDTTEYSAFVKKRPEVGEVWNGETKTVSKDGKEYKNFEFAKKSNLADDKLEKILNKLTGIDLKLNTIGSLLQGKKHVENLDYPTPEQEGIDVNNTFPEDNTDFSEDLPF